mmetsp:Transcript_33571/g.43253  ORF Transcript_33571/g.43253 Transcript_33571/m.43253 type:complete len:122 (-) Transcript_33571:665-1030(-)
MCVFCVCCLVTMAAWLSCDEQKKIEIEADREKQSGHTETSSLVDSPLTSSDGKEEAARAALVTEDTEESEESEEDDDDDGMLKAVPILIFFKADGPSISEEDEDIFIVTLSLASFLIRSLA